MLFQNNKIAQLREQLYPVNSVGKAAVNPSVLALENRSSQGEDDTLLTFVLSAGDVDNIAGGDF